MKPQPFFAARRVVGSHRPTKLRFRGPGTAAAGDQRRAPGGGRSSPRPLRPRLIGRWEAREEVFGASYPVETRYIYTYVDIYI